MPKAKPRKCKDCGIVTKFRARSMCDTCYHRDYMRLLRQKGYFSGTCVKCGSSQIFRKKLSMCEKCYNKYQYDTHREDCIAAQLKSVAKRKALGVECIGCGKPGAITKSMCDTCYQRSLYWANPEHYRAYERIRALDPSRREVNIGRAKKWRQNPDNGEHIREQRRKWSRSFAGIIYLTSPKRQYANTLSARRNRGDVRFRTTLAGQIDFKKRLKKAVEKDT